MYIRVTSRVKRDDHLHSQMNMTTSRPHIILLHGAWHSPAYFAKITSLLQDHLYVVHAQQSLSTGLPPSWTPPNDLSQDIAATRALLDYAIANGNDVIVICHSWGGIIAGSALVGYSKAERAEKGLKGGVVKCGYMCAFMVEEGVSLQRKYGDYPPWYDVNVNLRAHPQTEISLTRSSRPMSMPTTQRSSTMTCPEMNRHTGSHNSRLKASPLCKYLLLVRAGRPFRAATCYVSRIAFSRHRPRRALSKQP